MGIVGNELADQAAKSATQKTTVDIHTVPVRDVQNFIKRSLLQARQTEWQGTNFKLTTVKDSVRPWSSSFRSARREEIILTRLRIGHSFFSHSFLLRREDAPTCGMYVCGTNLSVEHVLLECPRF